MRKLALLVALCLVAPAVHAATRVPTGTLSAVSGSPCTTGDANVNSLIQTTGGANSVAITLAGTFTGAVMQFKASTDDVTFANVAADPQTGGTGVTNGTAVGTWIMPIANFHTVCVHLSALATGSVTVTLDSSFSSTYTVITAGRIA